MKTIKFVIMCVVVFFAMLGLYLMPKTSIMLNAISKQKKALTEYAKYYNATETLLDSCGVGIDSPMLETDAGSNYLDAKLHLDSILSTIHPKP